MGQIQYSFQMYEKKYLVSPVRYRELLAGLEDRMETDEYGIYTICNLYYDTEDFRLIRTSLKKPSYLFVEGGMVIIDGPSGRGNGAIDVGTENGGVCEISGGTVLAVGPAGMTETFGSGSSQYSFSCQLETPVEAGEELTISDSEGNVLISHRTKRQISSVIFSSPELAAGESLVLTAGDQTVEITLDQVSASAGANSRRER